MPATRFDASNRVLTRQRDILYLPPILSRLPQWIDTNSDSPKSLIHAPFNVNYTSSHLPDIDQASIDLHDTLQNFRPVVDEYASVPYEDAFNWNELKLPLEIERQWYAVAFRSKRKPSDSTSLYEADKAAHEEAVSNGGLLMYWYGTPALDGYNLATCIWQSRQHALQANSKPEHVKAMRLAAQAYEVYTFERYVITKERGKEVLDIQKYAGGDVGF